MYSLQSDFSCTLESSDYTNGSYRAQTVLTTSSDSLKVWVEKAKSSDVAQSIPQCFYAITDLEMLTSVLVFLT
jgi:hypothetical protein